MQTTLTSGAVFHQRPGNVRFLAVRLTAVAALAFVVGMTFTAGPTAAAQGDRRGEVAISGELKQWHKVTLTLDGPLARESDDSPNPFTDCRMMVTFRHESGSPQYVVPGYFAADGELLGDRSVLTGASLQNGWSSAHQPTLNWATESRKAGHPWVVANDEQNPASLGVPPDPGYPPSPVIKEILWAPPETSLRRAKGSDNWPMTWADDDWLYTAYGDGNGFEPRLKEKLSLGLSRVRGDPPRVVAENLRAPSLEQKGDGARGKKASGLLMIDGVLYLWARNAGNAQLAWSADHGATWSWADWKLTTSFGCPAFLNFGRNYAGARDEFVYVYSHDSDSAYQRADRMVLARAAKNRLREQAAYEFFQELDAQGLPVWTKAVTRRGAVLTSPGRCYRSSVSYNAGLKRYLWVQTGLGEDTRFAGGLGIYDAPEPWGPWTTVFATDAWDVGPGETAGFPTKWISPDGCTLHLVSSGDDCFSVRRATLKLR